MKSPKELWVEKYEEGKASGMSDDDAGVYATQGAAESYAEACDRAKDARKDRMLEKSHLPMPRRT